MLEGVARWWACLREACWLRRRMRFGFGGDGGGFARDFGGGFVFAEAEEGGLADEVVGGPGGEADLGYELGADPEDVRGRRRGGWAAKAGWGCGV